MKRKIYILTLTVITLSSCVTKINADGKVLSKNNVAVPGAVVTFFYSSGGKEQIVGQMESTCTAEGKFSFINKSTGYANAHVEKIGIKSDSGECVLNSGFPPVGHNMNLQIK